MLKIIRRVFDFGDWSRSHPSTPHPGDMLDAQFDEIIDRIDGWDARVRQAVDDQGRIAAGAVGFDAIQPAAVSRIEADLRAGLDPAVAAAEAARQTAGTALVEVRAALLEARALFSEAANISADIVALQAAAAARVEAANAAAADIAARSAQLAAESAEIRSDWDDAASEAEAWARSSALWAEHMPDTLPDNAVKIMDISGDHWSSRWWANRADNAFGRLTDLYLGAWPDPPTQNLEGGPIEVGSIYYDTDDQQPYVWDGNAWVPFWAPNRAATSTLWYPGAAGRTVFDLKTPDQNGDSYHLDPAHPEGFDVHLNGVKLVPTRTGPEGDYTIDFVNSVLTLARPTRAGDMVSVDILVNPDQLAPGAAEVWSLKTTVAADGVVVSFPLQTRTAGGPLVSIVRSEELLVSLDGVIQEPGVAYTAIAASVSFTSAPATDARIFYTWFRSAGAP